MKSVNLYFANIIIISLGFSTLGYSKYMPNKRLQSDKMPTAREV